MKQLGAAAVLRVVVAVAARPRLWTVALRQLRTLAAPGWWRRAPHLPLPAPEYLRFRLVTAYGGDGSPRPPELARDVVAYLRWCRGGTAARSSGWRRTESGTVSP